MKKKAKVFLKSSDIVYVNKKCNILIRNVAFFILGFYHILSIQQF